MMIRLVGVVMLCVLPVMAAAQVDQGPRNATFEPAFDGQTRAPELPATDIEVSVFVSGFDFPWGIALLPDGRFLVTEREGVMKVIGTDGAVASVTGVPAVRNNRQGGLLDVAVGADGLVYWTYSKAVRGGTALAAARGRLEGSALLDVEDIFIQDPPGRTGQHFGSRIIPVEGGAWITTGDRGTPELAQGNNTVGKVLWFDGSDVTVWSTGHRNMQGAIVQDGLLWTVEHGPRGGDELNRPQQGRNYGWPVISYGINYNGRDVTGGLAVANGYEQPVYYWDPVIAPGGMGAYPQDGPYPPWRGDLLVSSLRPGGVNRLKIEDGRVVGEERLLPNVGRVRDLEVLPNGDLLVLMDALDGDILRVRPQ